MHLLHLPFRTGRAAAALCLLATLLAGEAADSWHHLAEQGCGSGAHAPGERDQDCTCAALHAVPLGDDAPALMTPVVLARRFAVADVEATPHVHRSAEAAPRAPPRD